MVSSTATTAAFLATGLISLAPNLILLLFPQVTEGAQWLQLGQCMAAGGLLGDVFLHTLSHVEGGGGLWILIGFTIFLVADGLIRSLEGGGGHSHHHTKKGEDTHDRHDNRSKNSSTVLLNLAADAMHNFTDGLAIGATFAVDRHSDLTLAALLASRGGLATLSVLFHEIPHELGDFCTLVRGGYTKAQAVSAQFATAVAAFLGTWTALQYSEGVIGEKLLLVTAGGFVYLAAVNIIPDVLQEEANLSTRVSQLVAFLLGIAFLQIVAELESHDEHHEHEHHHHAHHHHVRDQVPTSHSEIHDHLLSTPSHHEL